MSSIFDSEESGSVFSEPIPTTKNNYPFQIAHEMIRHILDKAEQRIDRKQAFRETLKGYMKAKTKGNIREVGSLHFFTCKADQSRIPL